jgi:hypothetical protein
MAAPGHHARGQDMIDAPAEVPLEGIPEEIPVGVLNEVRVKLAEDVDESPRGGLFVSAPGVDVEIGIVHAFFRVVNIDGLGGDGICYLIGPRPYDPIATFWQKINYFGRCTNLPMSAFNILITNIK